MRTETFCCTFSAAKKEDDLKVTLYSVVTSLVEAAYSLKELLCVLVEIVGVVFGVGVEVVLRAEVPVAAVPAVTDVSHANYLTHLTGIARSGVPVFTM